ncbi:hypothetical protein [Micromonospora psammae]|uniref:hypothetical protein n=1 Tax=Micromonospora sp. CPCC 205556 TaxID=3122398 RepID=UPI002FF1774C
MTGAAGPLHHVAWQQALGEWGRDLPEELFYAWGGRPAADITATLNERHGLIMPVATAPEVLAHIEDGHGGCMASVRMPAPWQRRPADHR